MPAAMTGAMLRWWLVLVLTVVSTTAWAQPASEPRLVAATARAQDSVTAIQRYLAQLQAQRAALRQRLNEELAAIDRLKRGPRGWRTKSQLEDRLAEANETQKALQRADAQVDGASRQLAAARAALVAAIDAELRAGASGSRARSLRALRTELTPKRAARRIVLPDTKVDPGLDPEELDEQVAAISQVEAELERQIKGLEERAAELQQAHDLRQQHARMIEIDRREDNSSRRNGPQPSGARPLGEAAAPPTDSMGAIFETDASTVLPEVVDPAVLDGILAAQRSGDLGKRATAVRNARDAVTRRLQELRAKRSQIQGLAKQRRR
jgi:DNA repair exonuclease SbcCD ATPase subunit